MIRSEVVMTSLEVFVWAIIGGLFVAALSAAAVYYNNELPTKKQLSRDFLIGSAFTGFLYPLIPETFDEVKNTVVSTASDIQKNVPSGLSGSIIQAGDPGIKIGPANF
jgi:formate/nitrite transporter FocA (FNT family)